MSGRNEQLGKQLRRLRTSAAIEDADACETALRRATHLVRDLVHEHAEADEHDAALAELVSKRIVDAALAERIAACIERFDEESGVEPAGIEELLADGAVLDRFLRSIEHGALMPELPFEAYVSVGGIAESATSKSALTVSGRHVLLAERGREGMVFIDDKPVGRPFPLLAAPRTKPDVRHEATGVTRIVWEAENLVVELAADFTSASIIAAE
ncbi:MAG TPA: hypothetical protein VMZ53_11950 [Kofleriaceae bacterium]|nr:hypothetical protein [Kofleriaceae bacterium]